MDWNQLLTEHKDLVMVFVGFIGAIVAAAVGGVIAMVTADLKIRRGEIAERKRLYRVKLEDLHKLIVVLIGHFKPLGIAVQKGAALIQVDDTDTPHDEIKMLIGIYSPDLKEDYDDCAQFAQTTTNFYRRYIKSGSGEDKQLFTKNYTKLIEKLRTLQTEIIEQHKNHH